MAMARRSIGPTAKPWAFGVLLAFVTSSPVWAQTMARLTVTPWKGTDLAETYDHPLVQFQGNVNNVDDQTEVFFWDSFGRVRFDRHQQDSPFAAYRILTIDAGTDSQKLIKSTMDEFDLGIGFHIGRFGGWDVSSLLGAGYSSTHPFVHTTGIFGIGHLEAQHALDANDSLVLSVDYEGNGGFLPDVPLPGFAFVRHDAKLDAMVGYPYSRLLWRPVDPIELIATYNVPYTAEADVEYALIKHFGLYANAANFFQGFVVAPNSGVPAGDITNRQFYQMRRVEAGIRFIFDPWVDASIGVGYAFDQAFSRGFDVRNLEPIGHISNEPYIALVLRGTF
jgi:hypothetical protein